MNDKLDHSYTPWILLTDHGLSVMVLYIAIVDIAVAYVHAIM